MLDSVLAALDDAGSEGTRTNGGYQYQCPVHTDNRASLSVSENDETGRVLVYCHAGCSTYDVLTKLGLDWKDVFDKDRVPVTHYIYRSATGGPLYRVTRWEPKSFTQERYALGTWEPKLGDVQRVPYHLEEIANSTGNVWVTEGEKDADTLRALGVTATTLVGGAGKWRDEYAPYFQARHVTIVADKDDAGRTGAEKIAHKLRDVAASVRTVVARVGKDATDHVNAGLGLEDFEEEGADFDEFGPLDWEHYEAERTEWLLEPYVPRGGRVLAFGAAGSLKSLWAMWLASHVAKEGGKVAYFSLEMLPSITAQRLKRLSPPRERFLCFTRDFRLGSPGHTEKLIRGLKDFDLIVIDSWTAARAGMKDSNEQVSELDTEFFLPIIKNTGATVLVIDNTGHAAMTDKGPVKMQHARGASAKGDKMDVTILFDRPYEDNNYLTRMAVKKMRFDQPMPKPVEVYTPTHNIEFFYTESDKPMWPGLDFIPKAEVTPHEEAAEARLRDRFGGLK